MFDRFLDFIPFLMTVDRRHKINSTRILEALIIAIIGGVFAGYIAFSKMEVKFEYLQTNVMELKQDMQKLRYDLYRPANQANKPRN